MAKAKTTIVTITAVKHEGKLHAPGTQLSMEKDEAQRIIKLGAARVQYPEEEVENKKAAKAAADAQKEVDALIAKINEAKTTDALAELCPEQPENDDVAAAFAAKWDELDPTDEGTGAGN